MNKNKWTMINDDPIVLNLSDCKNPDILHKTIRKTFGFPAYYGENWSALWDLLRDMFFLNEKRHICIKGFDLMSPEMQGYCQPMKRNFQRLCDSYSNVTIEYL